MKIVPLTQGKQAFVDDADYDFISKNKWFAVRSGANFYAGRNIGKKLFFMHNLIMPGGMIDHKNRIGLDNQRSNLRICNHNQNNANKPKFGNTTSRFKGVYWNKTRNKWQVCCGRSGYIGRFSNELEAAKAYDKKAKELFGEFAVTNF